MTFEEYKQKRAALMAQLGSLVNDMSPDAEKNFQSKKSEIDALDREWERIRDRHEAVAMLSDNQAGQLPPWLKGNAGGIIMGGKGYNFQQNTFSNDPLVLSDTRHMVDIAREKHTEQASLLSRDNALGDTVRGIVTGKWTDNDLKNMVTTSGTSVIIPEVLSAQVIDLARAQSLFGAAKVPVIPMETNNLTISRVKTDPTFAFKEEGEESTESSFELDSVELKAKTIYGYCYVTLEAIESSRNLDTIIRNTFAAAIAQGIDRTMLYGQSDGEGGYDAFAPAGIMNDSDILVVESANDGSTNVVSYDDFIKALGKIRKNNGDARAWAINAETEEALALLKDINHREMPVPSILEGMQKIVTNQLAHDETDGSDALVFDPSALLIGMQNSLRIKVVDGSDEALKKGLIAFQLYSMVDCRVIRPKAVCKITGIGSAAAVAAAAGD